MARRPENPRNRGRRSESPLDWLNENAENDQVEQQSGPAPTVDAWRPDPGYPPPAGPRPRPDPPVLGRRAARAQREAALQAEQARGKQPAPSPYRVPPRGEQTQIVPAWRDQAPPHQAVPEATQIAPAGRDRFAPGRPPHDDPAQTWIRPVPADLRADLPADLRADPVAHRSTGFPPAARERGPRRGQGPQDEPSWTGGDGPGNAVHEEENYGDGDDGDTDHEPKRRATSGPRRRRVAFGLSLAALLLVLWAATSFLDSTNPVVTALSAIAPLVSVFALPVIAIGVASNHLVPTGIAVVAALLPWTLVTGYAAAGPGRTSPGDNPTLRVMSVDGAEGRASATDIVQVARLYAVDIVVVTDLSSELTHELTGAGLNTLAPSRWVNVPPGSVNGTGVWSRPGITELTPITGLSRTGVDGVIDAGPDKIGISVVHLAGQPLRPGPDWRSDLAELGNRTPPAETSFIVGDLNAGPWQPAFRELTATKWRDAADVIGQGLRPTWPSWSPLPIAPVDHVLASPGLGVAGADTTNIGGSSNRALIVTLILPPAGG